MKTTIYFAGSIGGGRQDAALYARLIKKLQAFGPVLTTHVGDPNVIKNEEHMTDKEIHDRDLVWLKQTDVIVAEVTQTSLGVGYEIGRAVGMGKPVLCLFRPKPGKPISAMIGGIHDGEYMIVKYYKEEEEVDDIFDSFFKNITHS